MQNLSIPKLEEKVLKFWKKNRIFEKSLEQRKKSKPFRFFEGPPTTNAGPGLHHALSRAFKDIICRYKTMQGFHVERKAGWDNHGLPVELQIEKELGFKSKSDIEKYGISRFNQKAKGAVLRYITEWKEFTRRLGFWLDLENAYITYDPKYIESVWHILKTIWKKGLLEEDYKVVPYCPRCGTPLSSHEVALGYEDITEESVYLKFPLKGKKNHFILAWTTTPWTLPGNVGLAVNPKIDYSWVRLKNSGEVLILATARLSVLSEDYEVIKEAKGAKLAGFRYEPLFDSLLKHKIPNVKNAFKVLVADFASAKEGTGVVHTAVMYGVEDFELGKKYDLPKYHTVDQNGLFTKDVKKWHGRFVKDVEKEIVQDLESRNLLYKKEFITHTYPFCWRCETPLLYYAHKSWFIRMTKVRRRLILNNQKINWAPSHIKEGRFGEWLREIKDWALSRDRYWATPLPIWICKKCGKKHAVGSLEELSDMTYGKNDFYRIRHGGASHIEKSYIASWPEKKSMISHLTEKGKKQVSRSAKELKKHKIDFIVSSDLTRMKETSQILKKYLKRAKIVYDPRLREYNTGIFNYKPIKSFRKYFKSDLEKFTKKPPKGETLENATNRYLRVIEDLEKKYQGKKILIVGHGDPLWALEGRLKGLTNEEIVKSPYPKLGRWEKMPFSRFPKNEEGKLDLHRPYVDKVLLSCPRCSSKMQRVPYVIDVWFDSGTMPFSQWHWPFENKERISKGTNFPADYISEAIDQTRGWFYTLHAISTVLGKGPSYLNVICLGHILDEKGEKMSKSKGNIVDPWEMFEKYGADVLRWYFFTINPPGEPKRFSERDLRVSMQDLTLLLNVLNFWKTYAPEKPEKLENRNWKLEILDKWILARLAETIEVSTKALDEYDTRSAALAIKDFIEDFSRWYIRRSRRRFQKPKNKKEFVAASMVLTEVLLALSKLLSPFTPFLAEYVWQEILFKSRKKHSLAQSVHLANWPKPGEYPCSKSLISKMNQIRDLASLGLNMRAARGIKVRQPLSRFYVEKNPQVQSLDKELLQILCDEINVKKTLLVKKLPAAPLDKQESAGFKLALDTKITPRLKEEGMLRELIRSIQEARQKLKLQPQDLVRVEVLAGGEVAKFLKGRTLLLKKESQAKQIVFAKPRTRFKKGVELEGERISLGIQKVKR